MTLVTALGPAIRACTASEGWGSGGTSSRSSSRCAGPGPLHLLPDTHAVTGISHVSVVRQPGTNERSR